MLRLFKMFSFIALFVISLNTFSGTIDSLKKVLNTASGDSLRVELLLKMGDHYENSQLDSSLFYYKKALDYTNLEKTPFLFSKCNRYLGIIYRKKNLISKALECYNDAHIASNKINDEHGLFSIYNNLGVIYRGLSNFDLSMNYYKKALDLNSVKKNNNNKAACYLNMGLLCNETSKFDMGLQYLQESLQLYESTKDQKGIMKCFINLGNAYMYLTKYDQAIEYINKALNLVSLYGDKQLEATCYQNLGNIISSQSNYESSINYFNKALKIYSDIKDNKGITNIHNNIGTVYLHQGEYEKAMDSFMKSLRNAEKYQYYKNVASSLTNIGNVQSKMKNYSKALDYFQQSKKICEKIDDKKGLARAYNNIGVMYSNINDFNKAELNFFKSIKIFETINLFNDQCESYLNLGIIKSKQNKYAEALNYYNKAVEKSKNTSDRYTMALIYSNIANIYLKRATENEKTDIANLNQCIKWALESYIIADSIKAYVIQKEAADYLMKAHDLEGDFEKAVHYAKINILLTDSLISDYKAKAITETEAKYSNEKKQLMIEKLNKEKELQISENKRQKAIILSVIIVIILIIIFTFFIIRRLKITKAQKKLIELQNTAISEKNEELNQQNEEIICQRDEIEAQRDLVTLQKKFLEEQKQEITDSIMYAQRIQQTVLPNSNTVSSILKENFIIYYPKDIVSGDFFWVTELNDWSIFAVADCTGHGVPGAFMSMLGVSFLNEIVRKKEVTKAGDVLNLLRFSIIEALQQKGNIFEQQDGMDIAFCAFNKKTNILQFAGANNPLWIVTQGELQEFKGDKMPIGIYEKMDSFKTHEIVINKGDCIYLMSDGYQDQFGGPYRKKFQIKRLRNLIADISHKPMSEQKILLEKTFDEWLHQGGENNHQIDDVTVLGIKI